MKNKNIDVVELTSDELIKINGGNCLTEALKA